MKRKKMISFIAVLLAVLMVVSLLASIIPATAYAVSQSDIDALQAKKNELSARVAEAQERLTGLQAQESSVLEVKAALEEQNASAKAALEIVAEEIAMYDEIIADKTEELIVAQAKEDEQLNRYRVRVRAMEESGGYNVLALVVNSASFADLLAALDDMGAIMDSDKELEHEYRAARQETERVKAEYEAVREECQEKQSALEEEKARIEQQIADTEEQLAALADQIEAAMQQYEAEQAAEQQAAAELTQLIAQYQAEQAEKQRAAAAAAAAAANGGGNSGGSSGGGGGSGLNAGAATGGGSFSWPVPCSSRVTSRFGYRADPFTGASSGHAGIDIDGFGNDGAPIVAAAGGTVVTATTGGGGYGTYVLIDHGNGYQTVYAHMSGLAVSSGDSVGAGQTIGYLGATGRATGTHCHFEVRENGTPIDPEQYFSGLSHWNC